MTTKKRSTRTSIAKTLVSVFVLAVFITPVWLTARWAIGISNSRDHRQVVDVPALQIRPIDKTSAPLKPLAEPLISISFDDGWESVYTQALPILQQDGFATTQYIISGTLPSQSYMSVAQLKSMQKAGHEIGAHTVDHPDLTTLDDKQLTYELVSSKNTLSKHFGPIRDFTSPYGAYNTYTLKAIGKHYRSQKNAEGDPAANDLEAINIKNDFNSLNLISYSIRQSTTLDDLNKLVKSAQQHNGWLILTYHQVDYSGEKFSVTPQEFKRQIDYLSHANIRSATIGQAMDVLAPNWKAGK
jgi:peptidoglycan/xylan/chitin deacetylase (PgdA/CDA1 family)